LLNNPEPVTIGKGKYAIKLLLPFMDASGFLATSPAIARFGTYDNGACVGKTILRHETPGHETPVFVEGHDGFFYNAIGLSCPGIEAYRDELKDHYPLADGKPLIVSVASKIDAGDVANLIEMLEGTFDGIELNVSCPNVARGMQAGQDPKLTSEYTSKAKEAAGERPVIVKVTPNIDDIEPIIKAAADAGADAILGINTPIGKYINPHSRQPHLTNETGGMSGPKVIEKGLHIIGQIAAIRDRGGYDFKIGAVGGIDVEAEYGARDISRYDEKGADFFQIGTTMFLDRPMEIERDGIKTVKQVLSGLRSELYDS
jgi:dihydroorotate dehydrogenase subfamily 1